MNACDGTLGGILKAHIADLHELQRLYTCHVPESVRGSRDFQLSVVYDVADVRL